jgi:hypothetical protein
VGEDEMNRNKTTKIAKDNFTVDKMMQEDVISSFTVLFLERLEMKDRDFH